MRIHHTTLSVVTALLLAAPTASALTLRPILLPSPGSSSSSSEASSEDSGSSSSSTGAPIFRPLLRPLKPLGSSSSTSSSSSVGVKKAVKLAPKGKYGEYCKAVKMALQKGSAITSPDPVVADHFNLSIDMLTKANALCDAMLADLKAASSSSSSSSASAQ